MERTAATAAGDGRPAAGPPDGSGLPVFVFGALRSGTTVFRLMLGSHPRIRSPGEADFLFDHLRRDPSHPTGWRYRLAELTESRIFRNKGLDVPPGLDGLDLLHSFLGQLSGPGDTVCTLNVHRNGARLAAALPEARVIHMLRDPRDVARSSIGMGWAGTLYHGVDHWMATEAGWDDIARRLDPGRILELRYEDLISDSETELRRVCGFLGLDFDPRVLSYHERSNYAPPDRSLVAQWRHKSSPADIALLEGKAGRLMRARGYAPAGPGVRPGPLRRLRLGALNRARVWSFKARRHGWLVVIAEKATRRLRLHGLNRRLRRRVRDGSARYLK